MQQQKLKSTGAYQPRGTESVEWIKELEDTIMEITEVEWNKGKRKKKKK